MPENTGNFYPNGRYGPGDGPPDEIELNDELEAGDDPSWLSGPYLEMSEWWQPINVCIGGTEAFRGNLEVLLPIQPREDEDAWKRRASEAVLSPFLTQIADQAAGLICRKPITLQSREEDGQVDEYWTEFIKDVDGYGTDLDAFARRTVLNSLLKGHSAVLVDYPATEPASTLAEEREQGLRAYFIEVRADQILGWRKDGDSPLAQINQIRINEYVTEPLGLFGDKTLRQIRVLEQGKWSIWRKGESSWVNHDQGEISPPMIPLAVTYSGKLGELMSKPPLLPIAHLNILHAKKMADLQHSLGVSAMAILMLKGYDDSDDTIGLSVNSAILVPPEGDGKYLEPASSSFDAQQNFITELENQMRNLGISTLFSQKFVSETAESKSMDRSGSDSMLSVVAQDLEQCLQNAIDMAGKYMNRGTPLVSVSRDFDLQKLDGDQIARYESMELNNLISHELFLEIMNRGEVLPDIDVDAEIERINAASLNELDRNAVGGVFGGNGSESANDDDEESAVRVEVLERIKRADKAEEGD